MVKTKQIGTHMGPNSVINSLDKTGIDGGEAWDWREKHKISRDIKNYRQYDSSFKK